MGIASNNLDNLGESWHVGYMWGREGVSKIEQLLCSNSFSECLRHSSSISVMEVKKTGVV